MKSELRMALALVASATLITLPLWVRKPAKDPGYICIPGLETGEKGVTNVTIRIVYKVHATGTNFVITGNTWSPSTNVDVAHDRAWEDDVVDWTPTSRDSTNSNHYKAFSVYGEPHKF